ncbi:hypothetical protein QTP86_006803 [Hemibagrus guttatus]|nr:hypothetical protein QTP86_006803 [Hemibagrus guttatus]
MHDPPSSISDLHSAQVPIGEDVTLMCASKAKPRPSYKWIYYHTSNVHIDDQDGVSLLHIKHAGGDNIGMYMCIASNDLGEHKKMVRVNVQGAKPTCPLFVRPDVVEVKYGETVNVEYKPIITEKVIQRVPLFHGYPVVLSCVAIGYPEPTITWIFNNEISEVENLTVKEETGEYTCVAVNPLGNDTKVVTVVMEEDYLPLIAGFVAVVVVIISVIFILIYSIYYKNTKMGHYTVEGAKPNAQNGNIAQNGKDGTIPMKKILV